MSKAKRLYNRIKNTERKINDLQNELYDLMKSLSYDRYIEFEVKSLKSKLDELSYRYPYISYEIYQKDMYDKFTWLISINYNCLLSDDVYDEITLIKDKFDKNYFLFTHNHELF